MRHFFSHFCFFIGSAGSCVQYRQLGGGRKTLTGLCARGPEPLPHHKSNLQTPATIRKRV